MDRAPAEMQELFPWCAWRESKKCRKCPGMSGFAGLMAGRKRDNVKLPETNGYNTFLTLSFGPTDNEDFRPISSIMVASIQLVSEAE